MATDGFPPFQGFIRLWHLVKVKGLRPMHSPSQTPAIPAYHAPFSLFARHPNLFFKQSFTVSIHLFRGLPPTQWAITSTLSYIDTLSNPVVFHSLHIGEHLHQAFRSHPSSLHTTLSVLLIPNRPLRLSICTTLILVLSISLHIISYRR